MINTQQEKLICVFGLGLSGISAARYFQKIGKPFFVVDSRSNPPNKEQLEALSFCQGRYFGEMPQAELNNASMIVVSPGVALDSEPLLNAQKTGVELIGDVELFCRQSTKKRIAITGSNGKSTVTDLTYRLLRAAGIDACIGGNFGVPVLDFLPQDSAEVYVLELSSFQLDTTRTLNADAAVLLNISEDHMDRYPDFETYCNSKLSVFDGATIKLVNADDKQATGGAPDSAIEMSLSNTKCRYHLLTQGENAWLVCNGKKIVNTAELSLSGKYNWGNALTALAILSELDVALDEPVLSVLKNYSGLAHRFQKVGESDSVEWINDSKATNVGATLAALNSIDATKFSPIILIAGGDAKGGDLSPLGPVLDEKVAQLILIGKDASSLAALVRPEQSQLADSMRDAVARAYQFIRARENAAKQSQGKAMVLLSPACASLDMFKDFAARGDAFTAAVRECL